jgi:parallel beta-helix repeat protein
MSIRAIAWLAGAGFLAAGPSRSDAPCLRLIRAGTQVQGDVRVCPGRYRVPDPGEKGVLIAAASGTRIDLSGVTIESGDSVPQRFTGIGVASRSVDGVTVLGGTVRGYRFGIRLEGGRNHRVSGTDVSGSRRADMRSTAERSDTLDRLDVSRPDRIEEYGGGVLLRGTFGVIVTGVVAHNAQNGIGLVDAANSYVADNDLSDNTGWAVHLFRSSHNTIIRNNGSRTRRCAAVADCGAAAILIREGSDSNTIADNDLTLSSIGVLLTGLPPGREPSIGNLVHRNDASLAAVAGFAVRGGLRVTLLDNRADSASIGLQLIRVSGSLARGNTLIGPRRAGIEVVQGGETGLEANAILGGPIGIRVVNPDSAATSRGFRIDDNMLAGVDRGIELKGVTGSRVRGNVFDGVGEGLVVDGTGHSTEVTGNVFLRAVRWFIDAPDLVAGGNYWATADASRAAARVHGRVSVLPWKPASAAGY